MSGRFMASVDKGKDDIRKFEEVGTHSSATRRSIGEALLFHEAIGAKRKEERLRYLERSAGARVAVRVTVFYSPRSHLLISNR